MTGEQLYVRTMELCRSVAIVENLRIRMARAIGTVNEPGLKEQLDFAKYQLLQLKTDPGYRLVPDPREQNPAHQTCEMENERLRIENAQLRISKENLWEMNADLKAELRKLRPTKRQGPTEVTHRGGHPVKGAPTPTQLSARLNERAGMQLANFDSFSGKIYISKAATEKLLAMLAEKAHADALAATTAFLATG